MLCKHHLSGSLTRGTYSDKNDIENVSYQT